MWQKFLYLVLLVVISCMFGETYAQTVEVSALTNISTETPSKTIAVKLMEPLQITNEQILKSGVILKGNMVDVSSPKRLKRSAQFSFEPTKYVDLNGKTYKVNQYIKASFTKPIDKGELAKSAVIGVGGFFVKGLSTGVAAVSGAIKNEEGNRLKSSAVSAYESSPVSYVEKGEEIEIKNGEHFYLKFPEVDTETSDDKNSDGIKGQNYSFTIEKE